MELSGETRGWRKRGKGPRLLLLLLLEDVHLLSPSDVATSFPHAAPSVSARPHRATANDLKNSNPLSPMTSRTAFTTPSSQKHLASSAVPSAAQHRSCVPCASVLHAPAMPAKTNTRGSRPPRRPSLVLAQDGVRSLRARVGSRGCPSRAGGRGGEGDRGGEGGTIIARDGRMDVGAAGTSRAGR